MNHIKSETKLQPFFVHFLFILLIFVLPKLNAQSSAKAINAMETFNGASFPSKITKKLLLNFSSEKMQDTLILEVEAGPIKSSASKITLKTFDNKLMKISGFATKIFAYKVFDMPTNVTVQQLNDVNFRDNYVLSMSTKKILAYTKNEIDGYLNKIIGKKEIVAQLISEGYTIEDKQVYNSLLKSKVLKSIIVKDYEDEGGMYIAYSPKTKWYVTLISYQ